MCWASSLSFIIYRYCTVFVRVSEVLQWDQNSCCFQYLTISQAKIIFLYKVLTIYRMTKLFIFLSSSSPLPAPNGILKVYIFLNPSCMAAAVSLSFSYIFFSSFIGMFTGTVFAVCDVILMRHIYDVPKNLPSWSAYLLWIFWIRLLICTLTIHIITCMRISTVLDVVLECSIREVNKTYLPSLCISRNQ